jgi:hypothetical protein
MKTPVKNSLNYYRVRQLDFDGKEFISSPLYIHMRNIDDHQFYISPNPVSSTSCFMMEFYWPESVALVQFQIVDASGRLVDDFADPVMEGYNMVNHQVNGIQPGLYYIVLSDDHGNYAAKILLSANKLTIVLTVLISNANGPIGLSPFVSGLGSPIVKNCIVLLPGAILIAKVVLLFLSSVKSIVLEGGLVSPRQSPAKHIS